MGPGGTYGSPGAVRVFVKIAAQWHHPAADVCSLLGVRPSTYEAWAADPDAALLNLKRSRSSVTHDGRSEA
jgi:hypothetical protein